MKKEGGVLGYGLGESGCYENLYIRRTCIGRKILDLIHGLMFEAIPLKNNDN